MEKLKKIRIKPPPPSANICSYSPISYEPPSSHMDKILGPRQYLSFYKDGCTLKTEYNKTSFNIGLGFIVFLTFQLLTFKLIGINIIELYFT